MIKKLVVLVTLLLEIKIGVAQIFVQDSTLNNLVHPANYQTCKQGELGGITKSGKGKQSMILIPGIGFGSDVFESFIRKYEMDYTTYAITPAGFGGTTGPPMPDTSIKYSAITWTNGIVTGVLNLIEKEQLNKPIIVAHFVTGTQVALNLALDYPDKISKVIIIGGSDYRYYASQKADGSWNDWETEKKYTPEQRGKLVEIFWAPKWFKTVTQNTWDSNNYQPEDYCIDSARGKQLFKTSSATPLQILIRYYLEYMTYDVSTRYRELTVPVLILIPDFIGLISITDASGNSIPNPSKVYLKYFHQENWLKAKESGNTILKFEVIPNTRLFLWYDNPTATYNAIDNFIK